MKKLNFFNIIKILALLGAFLAGYSFGILYKPTTYETVTINTEKTVKPVSIMIDQGDGTIKIERNIPWQSGLTVFDVLKIISDKQNLDLGFKDYGGELGIFIESINGKKGDGEAWWQYWVNNKYGDVGSGIAKVGQGDVIEWKLIKGQF